MKRYGPIAIIVPCYKRPEYTKKCLDALDEADVDEYSKFYIIDDGSNDATAEIINKHPIARRSFITINHTNTGLRNVLADTLKRIFVPGNRWGFVAKVDNDCVVPKDYFRKMMRVFDESDADILSPNVTPSNAAFKLGREDTEKKGYRPSKYVGGLWMMGAELLKDIVVEKHDVLGITGAFNILQQVIFEHDPVVGWAHEVTVQDLGHWSGQHKEHIKTPQHREYYHEIGRTVNW